MMWDHGAPRADGMVSRDQRPEADVNIEFQSASDLADESMKLAFVFKAAADAYNTDYPASVGPHMTNTDSGPFMNIVPSISLRENERGAQTGGGWNPTWHTPLDVWTTFTDKDFRLGLNAAQTTPVSADGSEGRRALIGRAERERLDARRLRRLLGGHHLLGARHHRCRVRFRGDARGVLRGARDARPRYSSWRRAGPDRRKVAEETPGIPLAGRIDRPGPGRRHRPRAGPRESR
jgi:hypothetical protein